MMKIKMILFSLFFLGCSVVGYRTTEEPEYKVVKKEKSFEIREYQPITVAKVVTQGDYEESSKKGFNKLAKYIFGENISMTAPVIQEKTNEGWIMRFTMPARYTFETLPMPIDNDIKIVMSESKKMAVITYTGILTEKKIESNTALLREWLIKNRYKELSPPQSAGYDPPWTIPFLRKNEVQIEIQSKQ
ncbi:MAG: SOUL family heme-binding protein [Fusobacteriaceae bacterium]